MAFRIHGSPGHLIVDRWPSLADDPYSDHGDPAHAADAEAIMEFFNHYVSLEHTVKRLYWELKSSYPEWDEEWEAERTRQMNEITAAITTQRETPPDETNHAASASHRSRRRSR